MAASPRRWLTGIVIALVALGALAVGGLKLATNELKGKIEQALGPNSVVDSIEVGMSSIAINGIHLRAAKGWPADEELSARQVVVRPDWGALMSRTIRIASIEIDDGYLSMLRRKDGKLVLLPALLGKAGDEGGKPEEKADAAGESLPEISIGRVTLRSAAIDFYDASVRQPAHKLRLEQTNVKLGQILLPALTGTTTLQLEGVVKGVHHDGKVAINGQIEIASKNSEMNTRLSGVDLVAFQPYLIKATETGVKKGLLDLDLRSTVKKNRLHAPGTVVLSGLELSSGKTFMGMPRSSVVSMMKDKDGRISVKFVLDGNIDDPKFSLNDNFSTRIGTSVAGSLGISLEGLAQGLGRTGGSAAQGISGAVGKLFGK